jgi:hypothetical protein
MLSDRHEKAAITLAAREGTASGGGELRPSDVKEAKRKIPSFDGIFHIGVIYTAGLFSLEDN